MDDNNMVVDGEIGETPKETAAVESGEVILNMESMIKSHMASLKTLTEEMNKHKGILDDIFENDPTFKEHSDKAKEAATVKANTRKEILKRPQAAELDTKVKSIKSQIKETQEALSDYLQEYARMSGVNEIEGDDGEVREIVYTARLVKRSF
jgi:hypothetical protein